MKTLLTSMIAVLAMSLCSGAAEKTPSAKLPADGAWVRYYVQAFDFNGRETISRMTIKLVGTQKVKGEVCRWLEFQDSVPGNAKLRGVTKFLIPEKDLLKSRNPLAHVVRAWEKTPTGARNMLKGITHIEYLDIFHGAALVFLPGPMAHAKTVAKRKSIDYQHGRLEMTKSFTGVHKVSYRSIFSPTIFSFHTDYTIWRHPKLAFGFAAATMKLTRFNSEVKARRYTWSIKYTVEAWGTDAKTALPKYK